MAYNLESLVKILEQNLHPEISRNRLEQSLIESLLEKAYSLREFFENSSPVSVATLEIQSLERRITYGAYLAEHVTECEGSSISFRTHVYQKVIKDFDSTKEQMMRIVDGIQQVPASPVSSRSDPNPRNIVVGLDQDMIELKRRLFGHQSKLGIIPIVGMGGIGKTTLTRNLYNDPSLVPHFDKRAWVTISQKHDVREIVLGLLRCLIGEQTKEMLEQSNTELASRLYQTLIGRRYLIVLDDMWSAEAWDETRMFLPDNDNGSRIMVTTRELSVANYAGLGRSHHQMNFLSDADSWNLLCRKVFAQDTCPPELKQVGVKIARDCRGLPLAIHVIGGLLLQSDRSQESWARVAEDVSRVVADQDEHVSNILFLSYNSLPYYLKPCLLYMAAFPEDYEIRASNLIRLWVAEGFLKPIPGKDMEEAAKVYLKALVDRNLILVGEQETKGNVKSYMIHDLLRDLCIKKAQEEKFLYVATEIQDLLEDIQSFRRVSIHTSDLAVDILGHKKFPLKLARSVLFPPMAKPPIAYCYEIFEMRLLRVLNMWMIEWEEFPNKLLELVNLRYLAFGLGSILPSSISYLRNLETLILHRFAPLYPTPVIEEFSSASDSDSESSSPRNYVMCLTVLPPSRLRHIKFKGDYSSSNVSCEESFLLGKNLQTLSTVTVGNGFPRFESVPNLKKLGLFVPHSHSSRIDLTCLTKLETLKCSSIRSSQTDSFLSFLHFPPSLQKLTLRECTIPLRHMNRIGTLPNLEVLILQNCTMESQTWMPTENEFRALKFLLLEKLNLVSWVADETHFPRLERLTIRDCSALQKIPSEIGDIPTLEMIEVHGHCKHSAVDSARKIQEEQSAMGNDGLQVRIKNLISLSFLKEDIE